MSLIFYGWGEPATFYIFLLSMLGNYTFGLIIAQGKARKLFLILCVSFNLGLLIYFKYIGFIIRNILSLTQNPILADSHLLSITLPIGISFYTFQAMSYVIDLYKGEVQLQKNPLKVMLYISLFPQLIAGPIVRYQTIENEINYRTINIDDIFYGIKQFCIGLSKKVLISNNVAIYADLAFDSNNIHSISQGAAILGIACYTIQIYFDFSGYSDMAIGLGRMFGFRFLENFNFPYIASTIQDFWRRWHISLSTWFRDYVYIPLGGNRKGTVRTYFNLIIIFLLCGIWHGAEWTFVFWGAYYGLFLSLERIPVIHNFIKRLPSFVKHSYTIIVVMIGWVFFRAENISHSFQYLGVIFGAGSGSEFFVGRASISLTITALIFGIIFSIPIFDKIIAFAQNLSNRFIRTMIIGSTNVLLILLLILCLIRVTPDNYNPFIYFRF